MTSIDAADFFGWSDLFDYMVTRELSHIRQNWELTWNHSDKRYMPEAESYAEAINQIFEELSSVNPPRNYHDHEDGLAEYLQKNSSWTLEKINGRWYGAPYEIVLEQGGFGDTDQHQLIIAAAGRVRAAINHGQQHFDDMEESHRYILSIVIIVILYHRSDA